MDLTAHYPELAQAQAQWRHRPAPDCLAGKVVLITGAGDGIGRALARTAALYGAHVVLLGRTRPKLDLAFDWISDHTHTRPVIVPSDLNELDEAGAAALAEHLRADYGRLDGLVHNASALGIKTPVEHYPQPRWREVLQVNVIAAAALTASLTPLLRETGAGAGRQASVIFTSSTVGRQGRAYWGAYAVSKFAVEGLMQVLADECVHEGAIRVNSLNPGGVRTAMRRAAYPGEDPRTLPTPETRLDLYLHLLSDAAQGVSGQAFDARNWPGPDA